VRPDDETAVSKGNSRHVIEVMGTVFSLDIRGGDVDPATIGRVADDLRWVDETFSTYRPDSQISLLASGQVRLKDCPPEVAEVLDLCVTAREMTGGFFTATPRGRLDPSGVVKGWAIARADRLLAEGGSNAHAVNGGGDIQTRGQPDPGQPWRLGIAHPLAKGELVAVVVGSGIALATSGSAERGHHIVNPFTERAATELASVSVVGPQITTADIYATAACAMGYAALDWLAALPEYAAVVVIANGDVWESPGFSAYA
jgi:thiamine biosynthesis lipoprotein